ncbi:MAG TPA: hypothetical protein ENK07_03850 [Bacteroidetes bacterium]|nr:hypothetical protein [Bacteroidota bacterium]
MVGEEEGVAVKDKQKRLLEILRVIGRPVTAQEIFEKATVRWQPDDIERTLYVMSRGGLVQMCLHQKKPHYCLPGQAPKEIEEVLNSHAETAKPEKEKMPKPKRKLVRVPKFPTKQERRELEVVINQVTEAATVFLERHRDLAMLALRLEKAGRENDVLRVGDRRHRYYNAGRLCYELFDELEALLNGTSQEKR